METRNKITFPNVDSETLKKIWDNNEKFRHNIMYAYRDDLMMDINDYMATLIKGGSCCWELDAWDNVTIDVNNSHDFAKDCRTMVEAYGVLDANAEFELRKLELFVRADELLYYDDFNDDDDMMGDMLEEQTKIVKEEICKVIKNELDCIYNDTDLYDWFVEVWCGEIYDCVSDDYYIDDDYILYRTFEECYK